MWIDHILFILSQLMDIRVAPLPGCCDQCCLNVCVQVFMVTWFYLPLPVHRRYQLQELNVRKVTLSTDKNKYGIRLRAEPDHMVLGKRLKGAFRAVMTSIKQLSSEELERFQESGGCLPWPARSMAPRTASHPGSCLTSTVTEVHNK